MNPDLYGAYRTADGHLGRLVDWYVLQIDAWGLAVVLAVQLAGLIALLCLVGSIGHLVGRMRDRCTARRDRAAAWRQLCTEPPTEQRQPGTDTGLYLDCVAIYDDCEELDRLRDAIDQHRTGEK